LQPIVGLQISLNLLLLVAQRQIPDLCKAIGTRIAAVPFAKDRTEGMD